MANAHKHKQRVLRQIPDALWADYGAAAERRNSDRSAISKQLFEWFAGYPGAELPERPEPQEHAPPAP